MKLKVEELTEATFARFGRVLGQPTSAQPDISDEIHSAWLGISDLMDIGQTPGRQITYLRINSNRQRCDRLEKHETSAEAFIPMEGQSVLVVVPADATNEAGGPDISQAKAFLMDGRKGVIFRRATWHALPWKLTKEATFLVLVDDAIISKQDLHITPIEGFEFDIVN